MHHNVLEIFLFLAIVVVVAKMAGWASTKLGQPAVLGEILAGLLLGPSLIGITNLGIFPESHHQLAHYQRQHDAYIQLLDQYQKSNPSDSGEHREIETIESELTEQLTRESGDAIKSIGILQNVPEADRDVIIEAAIKPLEEIGDGHKSFLEDVIKVLAEIGVLFLMFMAGLETDLVTMRRVGKAALLAAIGGVIAPFLLGFVVAFVLLPSHNIYVSIFTGTILCATSVSISAQTLKELHALTGKEGTTILGAAVIDDVLGIILLSLVIAFNPDAGSAGGAHSKMYESLTSWFASTMGLEGTTADVMGVGILVICMVLFFGIFTFFGMIYFEKILSWASRLPVSEPKLAFAIALGLIFAWSAEYIGAVAAITGTYLAGVLIGQTSHKHEIESKLAVITYSFFVPIFFINIGLEADAKHLGGGMMAFTILICLTAVIAKAGGCLAGAKIAGFNFQESLRVGVGMISRGEVGLIVASVGLSSRIIDKDIFSVMIIMVLFTTLVTPIMLRLVFPRKSHSETHHAESSH